MPFFKMPDKKGFLIDLVEPSSRQIFQTNHSDKLSTQIKQTNQAARKKSSNNDHSYQNELSPKK